VWGSISTFDCVVMYRSPTTTPTAMVARCSLALELLLASTNTRLTSDRYVQVRISHSGALGCMYISQFQHSANLCAGWFEPSNPSAIAILQLHWLSCLVRWIAQLLRQGTLCTSKSTCPNQPLVLIRTRTRTLRSASHPIGRHPILHPAQDHHLDVA
jgi:hypothetical protein